MAHEPVVQELARTALRLYPGEAAPLLEEMEVPALTAFLERLDASLSADVLRRLRADRAADVIEALPEPAAMHQPACRPWWA